MIGIYGHTCIEKVNRIYNSLLFFFFFIILCMYVMYKMHIEIVLSRAWGSTERKQFKLIFVPAEGI